MIMESNYHRKNQGENGGVFGVIITLLDPPSSLYGPMILRAAQLILGKTHAPGDSSRDLCNPLS